MADRIRAFAGERPRALIGPFSVADAPAAEAAITARIGPP
jgi:hypothetical protein